MESVTLATLLKVTLFNGCFSIVCKLYKQYRIKQSVSFEEKYSVTFSADAINTGEERELGGGVKLCVVKGALGGWKPIFRVGSASCGGDCRFVGILCNQMPCFILSSSSNKIVVFLVFLSSPRFEVQLLEERKLFAHIVCHACGEMGHKSTHCAVARRLAAEAAMRVCFSQ